MQQMLKAQQMTQAAQQQQQAMGYGAAGQQYI